MLLNLVMTTLLNLVTTTLLNLVMTRHSWRDNKTSGANLRKGPACHPLAQQVNNRPPFWQYTSRIPQSCHTSVLSGEAWLIELILGHPDRIRCELGVDVHTFKALTLELRRHRHQASTHISLEEQLAIFLYICVTGLPIRHIGECFQRSNDMISMYVTIYFYLDWIWCTHRYFHKMVNLFASEPLYSRYISFASSTIGMHPKIMNNFHFWPYFKDAISAIDGSHIPAFPPQCDRAVYRNRKGFVS